MNVKYAQDYNYHVTMIFSSLIFHGDFILYKNKYLKKLHFKYVYYQSFIKR